MVLIKTQEDLARYVPNILRAVAGEATVFEKAAAWLERAELWLTERLVPAAMVESLPEGARNLVAHIVAADAMHGALPGLDVVLTANGFGVVSNQNVAPASKERVDRLRAGLLGDRDRNINLLLEILPREVPLWLETEQAAWFRETMLPTLEVCKLARGTGIEKANSASDWDRYLLLRSKAMAAEMRLEATHFGRELMEVLRKEHQARQYRDVKHEMVANYTVGFLIGFVSGEMMPMAQGLTDAVNIVRGDEESFPEWHASAVKDLWEPKVFENKKENGGYWF